MKPPWMLSQALGWLCCAICHAESLQCSTTSRDSPWEGSRAGTRSSSFPWHSCWVCASAWRRRRLQTELLEGDLLSWSTNSASCWRGVRGGAPFWRQGCVSSAPLEQALPDLSDISSERYPCEIPELSGSTCVLAQLPGD